LCLRQRSPNRTIQQVTLQGFVQESPPQILL